MKRTTIIISLISPVIIILLFLLKETSFFSSGNNEQSSGIDKYINLNRISDKVLVINFAGDAVTAVAAQKGIVIIDAGISNSLTKTYRKIIEDEFGRNDFKYLINTHSHADHIGGNQVFPGAVIIGHDNILPEISKRWKNPGEKRRRIYKIVSDYDKKLDTLKPYTEDWIEAYCKKIKYQSYYNDLLNDHIVTGPAVTFNDCLNIFMGDINFNLIYFGKAHSGSDIIIHIPEERILMIGDLFFPGGIPGIGNVNKQEVERWVHVMRWIKNRRDKIDKVIGGHGQIMNRNDLQWFDEYVEKKYNELD
jgi:glyoxylase-like metal-dependent hydrolase (beta-lactamase superfamily II)